MSLFAFPAVASSASTSTFPWLEFYEGLVVKAGQQFGPGLQPGLSSLTEEFIRTSVSFAVKGESSELRDKVVESETEIVECLKGVKCQF